MRSHWIERLIIAGVASVCALLAGRFMAGGPAPAAAEQNAPMVTSALVPRFVDFDIGAATVRSGATHQDNTPSTPPYVELPNSGFPITLLNFTVPPDYADDSDFRVRVVWVTTEAPCFFLMGAGLVGYGPGHSAALFDTYWPGAASPQGESIIQVATSYSTQEVVIRFDADAGFPTYPGDAMALSLYRAAGDINDTCSVPMIIRSVSVTYDGWTNYVPLIAQ